jgi:hypothetical protein
VIAGAEREVQQRVPEAEARAVLAVLEAARAAAPAAVANGRPRYAFVRRVCGRVRIDPFAPRS